MNRKIFLFIIIIFLIATGAFFFSKIKNNKQDNPAENNITKDKITEDKKISTEEPKVTIKENVDGKIIEKQVVLTTLATMAIRGTVESVSAVKIRIKKDAESKELNITSTTLINSNTNGKYETKKVSDINVGSKVFAEYNTATMDITTMLLE